MRGRSFIFIRLLFAALILFVPACGGGGGGGGTPGDTVKQLENSIKLETESLLPKQISDDIYSSITSESSDPNYEQKLGQIDQKLDELTTAIEDANNTALKVKMKPNGSGIETLEKLTLNDFREKTRIIRETLNGIFGDISSSGRKLFLESGMGYGRSVSLEGGISGELGLGIFAELKAYGGGGVSIVHDFLHFQTAYSTFTVCGVDVGLGIGPGISFGAGASIGVSGGESWILGFSENIEESTKYPRVGVQVGPVISAQLGLGLELGVDVGYWQEIEEEQHNFSYVDQCFGLLASSNFGKLKAIFYSVGLNGEISTSGKLSAAMKLGTIGTRTLGLHKLVSFKNGSGKLDAIYAGLNMAINIITNKDGGVIITPSPVAFPAAATAILYGLLADINSPTDVTGLTASTLSASQIDLSWNSSTDDIGIAGYKIYRDGTLIGRSDIATYTDTGLAAATQYCYTIAAYDAAGNESGPSIQDCETTIAIPMAPTATVTNPADGSNYNEGDTVAFTGSGSDPEDGTLTGSFLVWTSSMDGQIGTGISVSTTTLSVGTHTITLTATDSDGATGTDSVNITNASQETTPDSWSTKTPMPTARSRVASSTVNGKIYVIGGEDGSGSFLSTVEEYDPATDSWTTKTPMPTARSRVASSTVNGKIYVIGGEDGSGSFLSTVEEYDPTTNIWSTKTAMPTGFITAGITSNVVNEKIYVLRGSFGPGPATVDEYDPVTDMWTAMSSGSVPRYFFSSRVVNGKIYVIGGQYPYDLDVVNEYDPTTDTWTNCGGICTPMPTARMATTSVVRGKIYAIGGHAMGYQLDERGLVYNNTPSYLNMVEEYDPTTDSWTTKTPMPTARIALAISSVNDKIYVIGGTNSLANNKIMWYEGTVSGSTTVEEYTPPTP